MWVWMMGLSLQEQLGMAGIAAAGFCGCLAFLDMVFRGTYRQRHETKSAHGTAAWAMPRDLRRAGLFKKGGLILGRFGGRLLRTTTNRHLLTLAPTRSGKGVGTIIPNLLTWPGSVIVIDPKGENAAVTARHRRDMGQRVYVLDPWGLSGEHPARFNPLDELDPLSDELGDDAALLADALVQPASDITDSSHWFEEARALLTGLILHTVCDEAPGQRTLLRVRELLTQDRKQFQNFLHLMQESRSAGGLVARAANRLRQKEVREFASVVSTTQAQTHFLDSPGLSETIASSTFRLEALRKDAVSIYLVLPSKRLHTHGRWLRLMVAQTLDHLSSDTTPPRFPVLFLLDEFAALGRLASIETAMGLMAGFGVQLWPVLQDLSQLKSLYPTRWSSFVANAGAIQAFCVNDMDTAKYISEMLGSRTVTVRGDTAYQQIGSVQYSRVARPLMMPEELRQLPANKQVLLLQGYRPALTDRVRYYEDREFAGLFETNPMQGG
jgi:type IV secretion system protein VirD4